MLVYASAALCVIWLDGECDQHDILAGLSSQFLFQRGNGVQQVCPITEIGVCIHKSFLFVYG